MTTETVVREQLITFNKDIPALTVADILDMVKVAMVTGQLTIHLTQGNVGSIKLIEQSRLISLDKIRR